MYPDTVCILPSLRSGRELENSSTDLHLPSKALWKCHNAVCAAGFVLREMFGEGSKEETQEMRGGEPLMGQWENSLIHLLFLS